MPLNGKIRLVLQLAWANGAPDVAADIAAMRTKRVDMALGSALGAGMFVTCLVGGQLARICNGKTYFIPDGNFLLPELLMTFELQKFVSIYNYKHILPCTLGTGVEDINDALSGSLTYQPAVSTDLLDILVFSHK